MSPLPRRRFLALAAVVGLGMTGCQVSDPVVHGGPTTAPPEPSPTSQPLLPGQQVALEHETELAALAAQVRAATDRLQLSADQNATLGWLASGHGAHATALLDPQPARRSTAPPTPSPGRTPLPRPTPTVTLDARTRDQAVRRLQEELDRALGDYRTAAVGDQGPTALVWGSLAAYARAAQVALDQNITRSVPPTVAVRELAPWSDAEAEQQVLRQVHALIYGYQVAIPWLPRTEARTAQALLTERRELRDHLAATLRERGQAAPAAEPAYALPVQPTDREQASTLLWHMESAFAPFAGGWLAAATTADARRQALAALERTAAMTAEWGGPLVVWPGWPL